MLLGFLCFCVAISPDVRDYIVEELLREDGIWDVTGPDIVTRVVVVLSACCEEQLTSSQMQRIDDYAILLPNELVVDKLRLLKAACRSLAELVPKHALVNNIAHGFVESE